MNATCELRLVSKNDSSQQFFVDIDASKLPSLAPSSVRIQTRMIGLSATAIAYCALGDQIGWWNCFPVPPQAPSTYQDGHHGVAPSWGYAQIVESTISTLRPCTWLWGYMPTSTFPFDLELKQSAGVPEHWQEVSDRRAQIQSLYNRYILVNQPAKDMGKEIVKFTCSLFSLWESSYLLNQYCFAGPSKTALHPSSGKAEGWSVEDSDLSSALVVVLAAGSKTGRAFLHQLSAKSINGQKPVVLLITAEKENNLLGKRVSYEELHSGNAPFLEGLNAGKMAIVDFGGRGNALPELLDQLKAHMPEAKRIIISVGAELAARTADELKAKVFLGIQNQGLVFGTAVMNEGAIKLLGEKQYYEKVNAEFRKMVDGELSRNKGSSSDGKVLGVRLDERSGLRGDHGLEGAWDDLYSGKALGSSGIVVDFANGDNEPPLSQM